MKSPYAPLPVRRVRARVAPGHHRRRGAAGQDLPCRAAVGLGRVVFQHLSMARVAEGLAVSWNTANDAVLAEGQRLLIADPARLGGVKVVGVMSTPGGTPGAVTSTPTVIIDLAPVRDGTGPSRLRDMVEGRSKKAFKDWLADRGQSWRDGIEVVAMDGFSGFKTATTEELADAVTVIDPFHVIRLAGLEAGEPVHRDHLDALAPRLGALREPGLERLLGAALNHVQQPGGAGAVTDAGQVDDHGDVLVAAAGVSPVGSARGAVLGLLRVRFPGPPAEPGVRFSPHRALHVRLLFRRRCLSVSTGSGSGSRGSGTGQQGRWPRP